MQEQTCICETVNKLRIDPTIKEIETLTKHSKKLAKDQKTQQKQSNKQTNKHLDIRSRDLQDAPKTPRAKRAAVVELAAARK